MQQSGELQVVLRSVDGGSSNSRARSELSRLLRLEDRIVGSIIDRAPIILLRDVPAQEAELARGGMTALSGQGITIDLDPDAIGLPKVNWPSPPRLSDLFPVQRQSSAEIDALNTKIAELEARIAQLEAAVGVSAASAAPVAVAPVAAAPAPAAPAAPAAPPVPAGPVDGVPALLGELNAPMAEVLDAIPFYETGDNGALTAGGAAVVEEVAPLAPSGGDDIAELEPLDLTDDIGPGEELQPLEALEPVTGEAPIELEPVGGAVDEIKLEPLGGGDEDEELPAWTGRARDYKSDKKKKAQPEPEEEELEPWTGRARDYKSESQRKSEVEELPELDLGDAGDEPVVAPTIVPEPSAAIDDSDDLDDLPDLLEPVVEPGKGVKRRKTGSAKQPSKKVARKASKKVAKKGTSKKAEAPAKKPTKKKAAAGDAAYSVFLSKISSASKKQAAIELLSEIKGIDEDAAAALCGKMIIPVAQGVTKDEAEEILGQFTAHKIQGRITKKRK